MRSAMRLILLLILGWSPWASPAAAQTTVIPPGTLTFVLPFAAGGPVDAVARLIGDRVGAKLGRPVIIENKGGAGGDIAAASVVRADPNGLTWFFTVDSVLTINPHINANQGFDPAALTPVAKIGEVVLLLAVNPAKVPVKSYTEMVAFSQTHELSFGSAGNGSPGHLAFEYLRSVSNVKGVHVPYRGAAVALTDLIGGNIDAAFIVSGVLVPHIKAGTLKALAVSANRRVDDLPDVPTAREAGIPDFEARFANLLLAPATTPAPILELMEKTVLEAAQDPEFRAKLKFLSTDPEFAGRGEAAAWITREKERWGKVVKASGASAK